MLLQIILVICAYIHYTLGSSYCPVNSDDTYPTSEFCRNEMRKNNFGGNKNIDITSYVPPFPAFSTLFPSNITEIILVVFGTQIINVSYQDNYHNIIQSSLNNTHHTPIHWDTAVFIDVENITNYIYFCYFKDIYSWSLFMKNSDYAAWISQPERLNNDQNGFYEEIFFIPITNVETLHAGDYLNSNIRGISNLASYWFETKIHGYYGSARDRMNASAYNNFYGSNDYKLKKEISFETRGNKYTVETPINMNIIRSGQDITKSSSNDQIVYVNELEPVLMKGMKFLQDNPLETGCIDLRFITDINKTDNIVTDGSTAGFGYFVNLFDLEQWSKVHSTHLKIFGKLFELLKDGHLQSVYLWHEIYVSSHGFANYINVHKKTGLLRWYGSEQQCKSRA